MENSRNTGQLNWIHCPECGKTLFQVEPDAVIKGILIKCRGCRRIVKINRLEP